MKEYRTDLDLIKGLSIIAVILYHFGVDRSGYLGVDAFFVINGFLIIPGVCRKIESNEYRYLNFLAKRLLRIYPVLIVACFACLLIGYAGMLPDDYEGLSQQVFASAFSSNNILQALTTNNYWNIANDFKPLMHTWYIGIIVQFYVIFPLLLLGLRAVCRKFRGNLSVWNRNFLIVSGVLSFLAFMMPFIDTGSKFYFLPFRYYEFVLGGLAAYLYSRYGHECLSRNLKKLCFILLAAVIVLFFFGSIYVDFNHLGLQIVPIGADYTATSALPLPNWLLVTVTALFTAAFIMLSPGNMNFGARNFLVLTGKRSYSLFIWHQIIIAFFRYYICYEMTVAMLLALFVFIALVSEASYRIVEKGDPARSKAMMIVLIIMAIASVGGSLFVYSHAGVVRDIPELGISKDNIRRSMNSEYCDRVYDYDKDFAKAGDGEKVNVLIVGNSFGRDWGNVLLESEYSDRINLSYHFSYEKDIIKRIKESDYIFTFMKKEDLPDYVWENIDEDRVWGIGTKSFGESNGVIYARRFTDGYFDQKVKLSEPYIALNDEFRNSWGDHYIDMMSLVSDKNNMVRIFTDDHMFLSQDCHHLTKAGAQFFAEKTDLDEIFRDIGNR